MDTSDLKGWRRVDGTTVLCKQKAPLRKEAAGRLSLLRGRRPENLPKRLSLRCETRAGSPLIKQTFSYKRNGVHRGNEERESTKKQIALALDPAGSESYRNGQSPRVAAAKRKQTRDTQAGDKREAETARVGPQPFRSERTLLLCKDTLDQKSSPRSKDR